MELQGDETLEDIQEQLKEARENRRLTAVKTLRATERLLLLKQIDDLELEK